MEIERSLTKEEEVLLLKSSWPGDQFMNIEDLKKWCEYQLSAGRKIFKAEAINEDEIWILSKE